MPKLITSRTRIEDLKKPRIIVIGGGFGGMEVIKRLQGVNAQVVLFDKYNHHTFQPLLYQVATSALQTNSIVYPFRKRFFNYPDFYFRLAEVKEINPETKSIETSIGSVKYDFLILAAGSATNYFGNAELEKNTLPLKTITDSIALRNRIIRNFELALLSDDELVTSSYMDYVIVGGGPTGVEVAGALAELKRHVFPRDYPELDMDAMRIHLVEASSRLLNGMSEHAGQKALKYLEELGVQVNLNNQLEHYDGYVARFNAMDPIPTRSVVWAAGVKAIQIKGLPQEVYGAAGRVLVNEFNQVQGLNHIYAIGDMALMASDEHPKGFPMMAAPAISQGQRLADNLKAVIRGKPMKPYRYVNKGSMATIGRNLAVADIKGLHFSGFFAWFIWIFVHLMSLVSFRNRVAVFFSWMINYFSYDKSNRFIIGNSFGADPDSNGNSLDSAILEEDRKRQMADMPKH